MNQYFSIFYEKFKQALNENKEYKTNLYGIILSDFFSLITYLLFFFVFRSFIGKEILNWNNFDFFIYTLILLVSGKIINLFSLWKLRNLILSGRLNSWIVKPINVYFFSSLLGIKGGRVVTTMFLFIILFFSILIKYNFLFLGLLMWIFSIIYSILLLNIFFLLYFFFKGKNSFLEVIKYLNSVIRQFTPKVFDKSNLEYFVLFIPTALMGYYTIEIFKGNFIIFHYYLKLILFFLFLLVINILMWEKGIKKYEAFG